MDCGKISVVMPVHNDAGFLPYSLASLIDAPIDELVLVMDRCCNGSEFLAKKFAVTTKYPVRVRLKRFARWENPVAEAFETVFSLAEGDLIYTMAADMVTDRRIYNSRFFNGCDLVSFRYRHGYGFHNGYMDFLNRLPFIYTSRFGKWSGHFAMKREVWEQLHYRDVRFPDKDFFDRAYTEGFKHRFLGGYDNIHLRSGIDKRKQLRHGRSRAVMGYHPLRVLAHSVFELQPHVLTGYLQEKLGG